jgi:hypothetical protein
VQSGVKDDDKGDYDDQHADEENPHHLEAGAASGSAFFNDRHGGHLLEQMGVDVQRVQPDSEQHKHHDGPDDGLDERRCTYRGCGGIIVGVNDSIFSHFSYLPFWRFAFLAASHLMRSTGYVRGN